MHQGLVRLFLFLAIIAPIAQALPLQTVPAFNTANPDSNKQAATSKLAVRGTGTTDFYYVEADTTTGALPVSFASGSTVTANQGTQGVSTSPWYVNLRSAGGTELATLAAPLRIDPTGTTTQPVSGTVAATQSGVWSTGRTWTLSAGSDAVVSRLNDGSGNPITSTASKLDVNASGTVAATQSGTWTVQPGNTANTTPWLATIAQGGNSATVSAGGALKVDGSASTQPVSGTVAVTQSTSPWIVAGGGTAGTAATGVVTVQGIAGATAVKVDGSAVTQPVSGTVSASNFPATVDTNSGAAGASTIRTVLATRHEAVATPLATQLSNGSSAIDYNSGAASAATVRTVLATRHEAVTTPLAVQLSNGSAAVTYDYGTPTSATPRTAAMLGVGSTAVSTSNPVPTSEQGHTYSDSARNDYSSTNVTTGAWVQLIASTAAAITQLYIDDTCGQVLELGTGGAGAETRKLLIPRGGFTNTVQLAIPAGTRVSLRAVSANCTTGDIVLTGLL